MWDEKKKLTGTGCKESISADDAACGMGEKIKMECKTGYETIKEEAKWWSKRQVKVNEDKETSREFNSLMKKEVLECDIVMMNLEMSKKILNGKHYQNHIHKASKR